MAGGMAAVLRNVQRGQAELDVVLADTDLAAEPVAPVGGVFQIDGRFGLVDAVVVDGLERRAVFGVEQADVDVIVAQLKACLGRGVMTEQATVPAMRDPGAEEVARFGLLELVAGVRAQLEKREVGKQPQAVMFGVGGCQGVTAGIAAVPFPGEYVAAAVAAVAGVE